MSSKECGLYKVAYELYPLAHCHLKMAVTNKAVEKISSDSDLGHQVIGCIAGYAIWIHRHVSVV